MDLEKLHDKNYIPFIERESKYDYISLGIEPVFTIKFEENLDFDVLPAAKMRTTRIATNSGRIKKMSAIKSTMFGDKNFDDDIKLAKKAPKESKTIETKTLEKLGTNRLANISSKNFSRPLQKDYKMLSKKDQDPKKTEDPKDFSRRGVPITIESFKVKPKNDLSENPSPTKRSNTSKEITKTRNIKTLHPPSTSVRAKLAQRKLINQKYTFKTIRSGSKKSTKKSTPQSTAKGEKAQLKETRSGCSFLNVRVNNTKSFQKSPSTTTMKVRRKNKHFFSAVESEEKSTNLHQEEEKSLKSENYSLRTPRSSVRNKKPPTSAYLRSLMSNEKQKTKLKPYLREQDFEALAQRTPKKEFGSAKKFKKENRGNRHKKSPQK